MEDEESLQYIRSLFPDLESLSEVELRKRLKTVLRWRHHYPRGSYGWASGFLFARVFVRRLRELRLS